MPQIIFKNNRAIFLNNGAFASDPACCDNTACWSCDIPTTWRIVDLSGYLYAQGPIDPSSELTFLPSPFAPLFYGSAGNKTFQLQVFGCPGQNEWETIEEWQGNIDVCNARYPSHALIGPWPPPPPCDCAKDAITGLPTDPCEPCPPLSSGVPGDGQEWREPDHGVGVIFNNFVDGEWTNLMNWRDSGGRRPARSLPGLGDDVEIAGQALTNFAGNIQVQKMTITQGGIFSLDASVVDLEVRDNGIVSSPENCFGMAVEVYVSDDTLFTGTSELRGKVIHGGPQPAIFEQDSKIYPGGVLVGDALLRNNARNYGTIDGDARFDNFASNEGSGVVTGDGDFNDYSQNLGKVEGNAHFSSQSKNGFGGIVDGNATFVGDSQNTSSGKVKGDASFSDNAKNRFNAVVEGFGTFSASARNEFGARVDGGAAFSGSSVNGPSGTVKGSPITFSGSSENEGTIIGNATFSGDAIHSGNCTGTVTFTENSCNDGGSASQFIPAAPNTPQC